MNQLFFVSLSTYINQREKQEIKKTSQEQEHHPLIPLFHAI